MASSSTSNSSKDTIAKYIPLYRAIRRGDWEKAEEIFNADEDALTAKIDVSGNSALHIAINTRKNIRFVENLLKKMNPETFPTLVNNEQRNVLHNAAVVGNTDAAKMVVKKNRRLLFIADKECLPIHRAILNYHIDTFQNLLKVSEQYEGHFLKEGYHYSPFQGEFGIMLIDNVINGGLYDVAYKLITKYPELARTKKGSCIPLKSIANKRDAYFSSTGYNFYQRFVYSYMPIVNNSSNDTNNIEDIEKQETFNAKCKRSPAVTQSMYVKFWKYSLLQVPHIKHLQEDKVKHYSALLLLNRICQEVGTLNSFGDIYEHYCDAFKLAVENDTPEAVEAIVECFPDAIWSKSNDYYLSQLAITNRCEKVYNFLVHQADDKHLHRTCTDKYGNNILHLAGKIAPIQKLNIVSGAALQMQRELQWFQEVQKFVLPGDKEEKNLNTQTPIMVFRREHEQLRKDGEEWMKKTADSYTITAALIITIAFAAAITVPGGNKDNGKAIYAAKASFIIFAVSNAISLFTSTTSLLLFLSILTARYREEDFLYKLPKRLILGLTMLFLSVTSMMVAFSATLYLLFGQEKTWILITIAALTSLPIASFVTLQFPLLVDLTSSTYGHGIFVKQRDCKSE